MNIVAFGASASKDSINKQFAIHAAQQFEGKKIILDLNDYPLPLYNIDVETEMGIPENAKSFYSQIQSADLLIISLAEHNGNFTAAFKSLFDWMSRYESNIFANKQLFLLSTSPGGRGGLSSLQTALSRFPIHGASILGHFSLPKFQENFNPSDGILNTDLKNEFEKIVVEIKSQL